MGGNRPKTQLLLAFADEDRGEAPKGVRRGIESSKAGRETETPATMDHLMEAICDTENLKQALKRVRSNKGSPGPDGMTVNQLSKYLGKHWPEIREQLLQGIYEPMPVKRVSIPKEGGGERLLGIPSVLDRLIQQAVMQILQRLWEPTFSDHSYGFRPGRSAHQAISKAQSYQQEGYQIVVDLDLEKFFDRVNHDRLMASLAQRVNDKRLLKLVRSFLTAGVLIGGLVSQTTEGTPQGGPLSPLLSNIVLDELDKELERRGHRFVRYADDGNIYVRSRRSGERVMKSVTHFIAKTLKLRVNEKKSAVARPWDRKFLGFSFGRGKEAQRRIAPQAQTRFRKRVRELTRRTRSVAWKRIVQDLQIYLRGWQGYYGFCQTPSTLKGLEEWMRRRLRSLIWKAWKRGRRRFAELTKRGVRKDLAAQTVGSPHGPWRLANSPALTMAFPIRFFDQQGIPRLVAHERSTRRTAVCGPACTVV
jgi:RNA-directed DNA polymerase